MVRAAVAAALLAPCAAFVPQANLRTSASASTSAGASAPASSASVTAAVTALGLSAVLGLSVSSRRSTKRSTNGTILRAEGQRRSAANPYLAYPEQLDGWVGGEKGFDPLGISNWSGTYWAREAELKHGRVCMLATVGWIATDLGFRFQGEQFQNISTLAAHDKMVQTGYMAQMLGFIFGLECYAIFLWLQAERNGLERDAGDFYLGKQFLPKDPVKADDLRLKELENGRLAMLAFAGIATQAALTGKIFPFV